MQSDQEQIKPTFIISDAGGEYRIHYWMGDRHVDYVHAGEFAHRLEHALNNWPLPEHLRATVSGWLQKQLPKKKKPRSLGSYRQGFSYRPR